MPRLSLFAVVGLLGAIVLGCAGSSRTEQTPSPPFPDRYHRVVTPTFAVQSASGERLSTPFYGGFNAPRPQFLDIDGDGDLDLFVQERPGQLTFFEHVSEADTSRLVWRTDHYRDLDIGEWYRFADLDQDSIPDLLTEQPYSYIRAYRNVGSASDPKFQLFTDTLRTPSGEPIFSDRQNIPNVTDLGCNGRLDLFLGRLDGTITRYESVGDSLGMPQFALVTEQFEGIKIVGQTGKSGPSLHGANTLTFADVGDDGDQDLFWGDFFEPGLLLIENTGSCRNPVLSGRPEKFPPGNPLKTSGYNAPTLVDWTGNGRLDLFVGVLGGSSNANTSLSKNFYFYEHTAEGYELRTRRFIGGIDVGSESRVAMGDLQGDGRPDLLVSNKIDPERGGTSLVYPFSNEDSGLRKGRALDLPEAYRYAPALGDLTGDGRADLVLGTWREGLSYHVNKDEGMFAVGDEVFGEQSSRNSTIPALGDLTDDDALDLVVGNSSGTIYFYRNQGTPSRPDFSGKPVKVAAVDGRSAPALHDVNGDGRLDLLVGTEKTLLLFRNQGTSKRPRFGENPSVIDLDGIPQRPTPSVGDLDGEGRMDLVLGGRRGGVVLFQARPSRQ